MEGDDEILLDDMEDTLDQLDTAVEGEKEEAAAAAAAADPLDALLKHHPECILEYAEAIATKIPITEAVAGGNDPNHMSAPFLTQYEKTMILGKRANQLSQNARPYIVVPEHVSNVLEIARMELDQKKLPFLVKRSMPNGSFEYWRLSDLILL